MNSVDNSSLETDQSSQKWLDYGSAIFAALLVMLSAGMFLLNKNSKEVSALIDSQNVAAIKLEENLTYYQWVHDSNNKDEKTKLFPPGLFEDLVVFSRNNAKIMYTIHRLSVRWRFWENPPRQNCPPDPKWCSIIAQVLPRLPSQESFSHVVVDPEINPDPHSGDNNIVREGYYQIRLYQSIRDYAQDVADSWRGRLLTTSAYILPIAYAVLGALFYVLRQRALPRILHRLVIAGVAGLAVSRLGDLLPQDFLLPPLAIAFVVGYSTDLLAARLDKLLHSDDVSNALHRGWGARPHVGNRSPSGVIARLDRN
jgi:hypothetical protein